MDSANRPAAGAFLLLRGGSGGASPDLYEAGTVREDSPAVDDELLARALARPWHDDDEYSLQVARLLTSFATDWVAPRGSAHLRK